jgi:hypothetical protein
MSEGGIAMTIGSGYDRYQNYYLNPVSDIYGARALSDPTDPNPKDPRTTTDDEEKKAGRRSSPEDCETCKNRKYQDGSNESNVSFKAPSHISPQSSGAAVRSHENEHVSNAYKSAAQGDGQVLSATVTIHTAVCPECGRSYISGGKTNTMIKYTNESNPYQQALKSTDAIKLRGANIDLVA